MQGGIAENYGLFGAGNSAPSNSSPWRLESDTEIRIVGDSVTLSGPVAGPGALLMTNSSGTLHLRGTNLYAGGTLVTRGRLSVIGASVLPLGTGDVRVRGDTGGQLGVQEAVRVTNAVAIRGYGWAESFGQLSALRFSSTGTVSGPVTLEGDSRIVAFASGDMGEVSGPISGAYNLQINWATNYSGTAGGTPGTGTITLSGDNAARRFRQSPGAQQSAAVRQPCATHRDVAGRETPDRQRSGSAH